MNEMALKHTQATVAGEQPKRRDSNLELFRIILMFFIIAHHYVLKVDTQNITGNTVFLQMFAMFGKPAINAFTLITGYFMVRSRVTVARFLRTFLEVKFYDFLFYVVFLLSGYAQFSFTGLFTTVFSVSYFAGHYYTGTYIVLFLLMPVLNVLVRNMTKTQYQYLLIVLLGYYTVISTFLLNNNFSFVGWLVTMYLLGGYISLHPIEAFNCVKVGAIGMVVSIFLMAASILVVDFIGVRFGFEIYDYMYSDANKFLALTCSVFSFLFFKNLKIPYSKVINSLAAPIFGILLIHTHSDTMRWLIWVDIFHCADFHDSPYLILHAIVTVVAVYLVCWALDSLRIRYVEKPLFGKLKASRWLTAMEEKMGGIL